MLKFVTRNRAFTITIAVAVALTCALLAAVLHTSDKIKATEQAAWFGRAKAETARLTDQLISNIYKTEVNLRAISERFRATGSATPEAFGALIADAKKWDPNVRFLAVAFAERLTSDERAAVEAQRGALTTLGSPNRRAADADRSYAVRAVAPPNPLIRVGTDLASHPAFLATIKTAERLPGTTIIGPSFNGAEGDREFPIAVLSSLGDAPGVVVATLKLEPFFAATTQDQASSGIGLRLIEYDARSGTDPLRTAVIGDMEAPEGVHTEVIRISRGLASWALYWDISKNFQGGPNKNIEYVTRYGGSILAVLLPAILAYLAIQSLRFKSQVREKTAELSRSAMIIQLTMDTIDQGFAVWNADHRLVVWSKRCLEFWYQPGPWLTAGTHMRDIFVHLANQGAFGDGDPEEIAQVELARVVGAGPQSEERFTMTDGRRVHVRRFPLDRGGHIAVYTDVTAQEKAIEELSHARDEMEDMVRDRTRDLIVARDKAEQASHAKTRLLANVSHELRTPLNAIIGFSEMIGMRSADDAVAEYAKNIKLAGEDLLSVVCDLLEISRVESGGAELDIEDVDIREAVDGVFVLVSGAARGSGPALVCSVPENLPPLRADPLRLKQILLNLIDNAVKFSADDSVTEVSASLDHDGDMIIRVRDRGIGIQPEDLPRILEPFAQVQDIMSRTHEGIGLGLPLARSLTEMMEGKLSIASVPGEGTTVTLVFPAAQVGRRAAPPPVEADRPGA